MSAPESKVAAPVDVLAVMDRARDVLGDFYFKYRRRIGPYATQALASVHQLPKARAAIAELIAADKEYDAAREAYNAKAPSGIGELDSRTEEDYERLRAAKARRRAALSSIEGGSQ